MYRLKQVWKIRVWQCNLHQMSTLTIDLDDNAARLVQEAAKAVNQPVSEWLRNSIYQAAAHTVTIPKESPRRISPLHPGAMQPTPDFNAPLAEFAPYA
jgi:hypothetical protein